MSRLFHAERLLIATKNKGKLREFATLFAPLGVQVQSLHDYPELPEVDETGTTFAANALLKARTIATLTGLPVLADDSGLCVERLHGAPGVFSARYAGVHGDDAANNRKLLTELQAQARQAAQQASPHAPSHASPSPVATDGTDGLSAAYFACALVLYIPQFDVTYAAEGTCHGYIISDPRGSHGFGYDPLFYVPQFGKTMAELSADEKNSISHRGAAIRRLMEQLTN
jgi:XTP/dITP diphosphohydrolase